MAVERIQSYLCGTWQSGNSDGANLENPATEEVIATASTDGLDLKKAVNYAREVGGKNLRALNFAERAEMLQRMSTALHSVREPLIDSAIQNGGCTRGDAKFDVDGAIAVLAYYAELGRTLGDGFTLPDGEGIQLGRSPRFWGQHIYSSRAGVAVLINAYNFPAWGFAEKAACALLAGMPVITKPATSTALTAYRATQALVENAELPEGALSFLGGSAGDLLDHLDGQDALAFTGSASTGARLRRHDAVIENSVPVNVEADSLNAAVLGPDLDLGDDATQLFLREITREMTQKTGQKCTATRRILVPEAMVDQVVEALTERFDEIVIGDPSQKGVRMGPVASKSQLADVRAGVETLLSECEAVYGTPGSTVDAQGIEAGKGYFHPILLLKAKNSAEAEKVHSLEVFGPVSTIVPYSGDAEEAVNLVRKGKGTLVSSVYSDDRKFLEAVALGMAPYTGRVYMGSSKVVDYALGSGLVLPECVHGGPGRAGGGEELGGLRGVKHFMQRTAVQGARPLVERFTGTKA